MKTEKLNSLKIEIPNVDYKKIESHPDLPKFYHLSCIYGSRGQGKTAVCSNIIKLEKPYVDKIYWFSSTAEADPKIKALIGNDKVQYIEEFNAKTLQEILDDMKQQIDDHNEEYAERKLLYKYYKKFGKIDENIIINLYERGLIKSIDKDFRYDYWEMKPNPVFSMVIDDELDNPLLSKRTNNFFNRFLIKHRHYPFFCNIYILVQNYSGLNNTIRRNQQQIILFPTQDKRLLKFIHEEIAGFFDFDKFTEIMRFIEQKPYSFLFIDKETKSIRRNLDEKIYI